MKIIHYFLSILFVFVNGVGQAQETNIVSGNLLVMVNSADAIHQLSKSVSYVQGVKTNFKVERSLSESMHIYLISFDSKAISDQMFLRIVKRNPHVKIAQFNHTFQERTVPDDPDYATMWNMNNNGDNGGIPDADIDAPEAWNITTGGLTPDGDTIVVAVIDNGFDITHNDLNYWRNNQEIPNNDIDDDNNGYIDDYNGWNTSTANDQFIPGAHGTHVSGIIGARGNNSLGVVGVNWNVKVMAVSYGAYGGSFESNLIAAYSYVLAQRRLYNQTNGTKGAFVVATNSSFGYDLASPSDYPIWCTMYDSLGSVGILSAAATANHDYNIDAQGDVPTGCSSNWLITVTSTTNTDQKNMSSAYGSTTIDLGAPGTDITSTYPSNTFGSTSGTSVATPHVAGAIALMYSVPCLELIKNSKSDPAGTALIIKDSLLNATDYNSDLDGITVSGGRLNIFKAVTSMQNYCTGASRDLVSDLEIKKVYPNPTNKELNIEFSSTLPIEMTITNVLGETVKRISEVAEKKGIQQRRIDLTDLNKGVYFVSIQSSIKKSNVVKFVVY